MPFQPGRLPYAPRLDLIPITYYLLPFTNYLLPLHYLGPAYYLPITYLTIYRDVY